MDETRANTMLNECPSLDQRYLKIKITGKLWKK